MPSDLITVSAFICQSVLREENGVLSAIRIADVINVQHKEGVTPKVSFFAVVFMKASSTEPSKRAVSIRLKEPSGEIQPLGSDQSLNFSSASAGHPSGASIVMEMSLAVRESGTHWLLVFIDEQEAAKIPITVVSASTAQG